MPALYPFFFFNDTATTEIYTLSLHDALPICPLLARAEGGARVGEVGGQQDPGVQVLREPVEPLAQARSEEHTSELQSRQYLVCRLLLEKKTSRYRSSPPRLHKAAGSSGLCVI